MRASGTLVLSFLFLLTLLGCNSSGGPSTVTVLNDGVFDPITFKIDGIDISEGGMFDLDEYENDTDPRIITVDVTNNTAYPMTGMGVVFSDTSKVEYSFEKDDIGDAVYPGWNGTCGSTLAPKTSCKITLAFETTISGTYYQGITFKFQNLIERDNRSSNFKVLAGFPASLVFGIIEDQADPGVVIDPPVYGAQNFFFGEEVGPSLTPVVERTDAIEYKTVLSVKNQGELRARSVQFNPNQTCSSKATGVCPGLGLTHLTTHTFEHNCPSILYSGDSCEVTISFIPSNDDPLPAPEEIRYIQFIATAILNYIDSPILTTAVLNGYFNTHSTEVRAIFESSIENLDFVDDIIVGNRVKKAVKINNNGFRHGLYRVMKFYSNVDGSHMASCVAKSGSDLLECFDETLVTPKTIEDFPFFVKDTQNCFRDSGESEFYVDVGAGCIYHLVFQPSIQYITSMDFDFTMEVEYDSRWKNAEFIIPRQVLQTTIATSIPAAKMNIVKVKLQDIEWEVPTFDFSDLTTSVKTFDLGRIALLSPSFFSRQQLTITLQNDGGVDAVNNLFLDGSGTSIPFTGTTPGGINLGPHEPTYFEGAKVNNSQCEVVIPGSTCIIIMDFAPIGLETNTEESQNMFDYIDADPYNNLKKFIMKYDDGANFSDTNLISTVRDIPQRTAETQLKAILVTKGYLKKYHDPDPDWHQINAIRGNKDENTITFQNIGTGPITYMPWTGTDIEALYKMEIEFFPTADLAGNGAQYDCLDIFDFDSGGEKATNPNYYEMQDTYAEVMLREASWGPLPKEETCALSYRVKPNNFNKVPSDTFLGTYYKPTDPDSEIFRMIDFDYVGDDALAWENRTTTIIDIKVHYYDGDSSDPALDEQNTMQEAFGRMIYSCDKQTVDPRCTYLRVEYAIVNHKRPSEIVITSPTPLMSAVLKRGTATISAHNVPDYMVFDPADDANWFLANNLSNTPPGIGGANYFEHSGCLGSVLPEKCPGFIIPSAWFYGSLTSMIDDPLFSLTLKSFTSIPHASAVVAALPTVSINDYEYIVHFGTFHKNMNHKLGFDINNIANSSATIFDIIETEFPEGGMVTDAFTFVGPFNLAPAPQVKTNPGDSDTWISIDGDGIRLPSGVAPGVTFSYKINASVAGIYKMELDIKYYDGVFIDGISGAKQVKNKKVLLVAEILDDAPLLEFEFQDYGVDVQVGDQPNVTFDPTFYPVTTYYNVGAPQPIDMIRFSGVKIETLPPCYPTFTNCTQDFYLRKRITMRNTSATEKMYNFQFYFKDTALALDTIAPDATDDLFIDYSDCSNADAALDEAGGTKDSCFIEIFYQPTIASTSFQTLLVARYETQSKQNVQQLIGLDFIAKDPAVVNVVGKGGKPISIDAVNTEPNSFPLDYKKVFMENEPQTMVFGKASGKFKILTIANPNENTNASFLKSYHNFLIQEGLKGFSAGSPPPIDYYPPPGDYYTSGVEDVVDIFRTKYVDDSTRVNVGASKACFDGDDPGDQAHFEKGFKFDTVAECRFVVTLNADINYIGNPLSPVDMNDMQDNFIRIWYYNNDRSSTAYLTLHFEGILEANASFKDNVTTADDYFDVTSTRDGVIDFSWDPMSVDNSTIGSITGYRVYYSESASALIAPSLSVGLDFVDISGVTNFTLSDEVIDGAFYFFKVVPIRQNSSYNAGAFEDLNPGYFLSDSDIQTLQVVSPPDSMEYNHEYKALIDRNLSMLQLMTYQDAVSNCQTKPSLFLYKGGAIQAFQYDLISEPIWNYIETDITLSAYSNVFTTTHWVKSPEFFNIDNELSEVPLYDSAQSSQLFETDRYFYFRNADDPSATVPMAKGGVISTSYEKMTSFIGENVPFGMPRCFVPVPQ